MPKQRFDRIAGPETWPAFSTLGARGGDRMSLIVGEAEADPALGFHHPSSWAALWSTTSGDDAVALLARAHRDGTARAKLSSIEEGGTPRFWDVALCSFGGGDALLSTARDATEQNLRDEELRQIAYHDGLTGLLNRLALRDRLASEISSAAATGVPVALLMLDLDISN